MKRWQKFILATLVLNIEWVSSAFPMDERGSQ